VDSFKIVIGPTSHKLFKNLCT